MTTPTKIRQIILRDAEKIVQLYLDAAQGKATFMRTLPEAREALFSIIKEMVLKADDPVPLTKLTDGDISDRVDAVLEKVATGEITPEDGKRLIALLQAGFEITELPSLLEKFSELENG